MYHKVKRLILIVCLLAFSSIASAGFINGNTYDNFSEVEKMVYVAGAIDAFSSAELGIKTYNENEVPLGLAQLGKCTEGKPLKQITAIVNNYHKNNPKYWHFDMSVTVITAIKESCY